MMPQYNFWLSYYLYINYIPRSLCRYGISIGSIGSIGFSISLFNFRFRRFNNSPPLL